MREHLRRSLDQVDPEFFRELLEAKWFDQVAARLLDETRRHPPRLIATNERPGPRLPSTPKRQEKSISCALVQLDGLWRT